ncbi:MAG: hypothetical protein H0W49_01790 [Nitrospirales bacterium]|nr:hypothetical protein [Nitrospirales bacterium]MBA3965822.1 hypothetical protein [Nitrospirales bacterium]
MKLELQEDVFTNVLCKEIITPGIWPIDVIERLLSQQLTASFEEANSIKFLRRPKMHIFPNYNKNRWPTLPDLVQHGYKTWYSEIRFSTDHSESFEDKQIEHAGIILEEMEFGCGLKRAYQIKSKRLKKQTNHILRMNILRIDGHIFERVRTALQNTLVEQPYIANPKAWPHDYGGGGNMPIFQFVSFDHLMTGTRLFCSCARPAHKKMLARAKLGAPSFAPNSWPHKVIGLLSKAEYGEVVCHLCVSQTHGADVAAARYGDNMHEFLDAYKDQLVLGSELDERTARADVQQKLNLSRWIQEAELYRMIKQIFPNELVFREASPFWLGRQRLDVFLPQLGLALEYQGKQHFEAVEVFGGAETFKRTLERDALKERLCKENAIELVYIKFSDPLTLPSLRHRLRRFVKFLC